MIAGHADLIGKEYNLRQRMYNIVSLLVSLRHDDMRKCHAS
jgi:hypothetical protein